MMMFFLFIAFSTFSSLKFYSYLYEMFEDTFPPSGWTVISTSSGLGTWHWRSGTYYHSPTHQAEVWWTTSLQDEWLITPWVKLQNSPSNQYFIEFWTMGYYGSTDGDHFYILISRDGINWDTLLDLSDLSPEGWNIYDSSLVIDISSYSGDSVEIAFRAYGPDGLFHAWGLDDVHIFSYSLYDIKVDTLLKPFGFYSKSFFFEPQVIVKNIGIKTCTTTVFCKIFNFPGVQEIYKDSISSILNPEASESLSFSPFNSTISGLFYLEIFSSLDKDEDHSNDTLRDYFGYYDWCNDFELDSANFMPFPDTCDWEYGTPTAGPLPYSGTKLWATNLNGNYSYFTDQHLLSPYYIALQDSPVLFFFHWYNTYAGYDGGYIRVKKKNGDFISVSPVKGYPSSSYGTPSYGGYSDWTPAFFLLPLRAYDTFRVDFTFFADGGGFKEGWYIDNLAFAKVDTVELKIKEESNPIKRKFLFTFPTLITPSSTFRLPKNRMIEIYDLNGRKILKINNFNKLQQIRKLHSGVYFLKFSSINWYTSPVFKKVIIIKF